MSRHRSWVCLCLALLVGACSSGPSLTDYAREIEAVVVAHNSAMDENDRVLEREPETIARIRTYATTRMELRTQFLAALQDLEPPREAEDLHAAAVETIRSLVESEYVLFERATTTDDLNELAGLWDSPAGQAARAADEKAIAICEAAQAAINSTEDRQALVGMPWVPTELQEVVNVAFGCRAADR